MRIAIISDIHDNWANLNRVLNYLKQEQISVLLCLGDLGSTDTLKMLAENYQGNIYYVLGNVEADLELDELSVQKYSNVTYYGKEFGELGIDNIRIAITHYPKVANSLAITGNYDFVFFGHTHKPDKIKITTKQNNKITILANPGNIAGIFYKASFAILDTKNNKLELKILDRI